MSLPRIAIIGGGPAGLTLARLLHVMTPLRPTVYELDASPTSRKEHGGTLDLHSDTGLAAIRACDLWSEFRKYARYEGSAMVIADRNATALVRLPGGERRSEFDRPEIDRVRLREVLLASLPEGCVRWGRKVVEVVRGGMVKFDDGKEEGPFELVVGADGAWSKVRAAVGGAAPVYSGVSGYEMDIKKGEAGEVVDGMIGEGSFAGMDDGLMLGGQRLGDGSLKVRSWFRCPEGEAARELEENGKEKTRERAIRRYDGWAPEMLEIFRRGDVKSLRCWTLYELPVGSRWPRTKGMTLIGDAASLMTPFSGEGVNKAMRDALELAEMLKKSVGSAAEMSLDQAVALYEDGMFPRSESIQAITMGNKTTVFGGAGVAVVLTTMLGRKAAESSSRWVRMLGSAPVLAAVSAYFWARKRIGWAVRVFWRRN